MPAFETVTFPGADAGMDLHSPVHMVDAQHARWIIEGLCDLPGVIHQRGAVDPRITLGDAGRRPMGMVVGYSPDDKLRGGVLNTNATDSEMDWFDPGAGSLIGTTTSLPITAGTSASSFVFDAKPALSKGMVVSWGTNYRTGRSHAMAYWRGATKANYSTGTMTSTRGSTGVTGAGTTWTTNVEPGMFLFRDDGAGNFTFLGVVQVVVSNTSITLEAPALASSAGTAYRITSLRPLQTRQGRGTVTTATNSAIVNGGGTKFNNMQTPSQWHMYRLKDLAFVGQVTSIQSDTQLTLSANAAIAMASEPYVLIRITQQFQYTATPANCLFHAVWQGHQFYANQSYDPPQFAPFNMIGEGKVGRVYHSHVGDMEILDMTTDGWWLEIPTSQHDDPIVGLTATQPCLVVFRESDVWGIFGPDADPLHWTVRKIHSDGAISPMSIQPYEGGVVWAGRNGIYFFDGSSVENLTKDNLGDFWIRSLEPFKVGDNKAWALIDRDHYIVYVEAVSLPFGWFKVDTEAKPTRLTFVLNLKSKAITLWTNVNIRGSAHIPAITAGNAGVWWAADTDQAGSHQPRLFNVRDLFALDTTGDQAKCFGDSLGPFFYVETAKYDMEDPQLKKLFKQFQVLHSLVSSGGAVMRVEVVPGFGTTGTLSATTLPNTGAGVWLNKRFKFLKRDRIVAFRMYTHTPTVFTDARIGPWAIGFKRQRPGRV